MSDTQPNDTVPDAGDKPLYDTFAPYYDLWTALAPGTKGDIEFYVAQARRLSPQAVVVELGVGTGRVATAIAQAGYQVIGVDLSQAMIDRAQARARAAGVADRLTFARADFTTWRPDRGVDLITCPYHTLGHVHDPAARRRLFQNAFASLVPGGRLVFNVSGPAAEANTPEGPGADRAALPFKDFGKIPVPGGHALVKTRSFHDTDKRITYTDVHGKIVANDTVVVDNIWTFELARIKEAEVRSLAADAGFNIEWVSGSFNETTPVGVEQVWVLSKPA